MFFRIPFFLAQTRLAISCSTYELLLMFFWFLGEKDVIILGDFNLGPDEEGRNEENYLSTGTWGRKNCPYVVLFVMIKNKNKTKHILCVLFCFCFKWFVLHPGRWQALSWFLLILAWRDPGKPSLCYRVGRKYSSGPSSSLACRISLFR